MMKLAAGMRIVEKATMYRYQVVMFDSVTVSLRRLKYAALTRESGMQWVVADINAAPLQINRRRDLTLYCTEAELETR